MADGFSPEFKHAPDAPRAGSGSFQGDQSRQPKKEATPTIPLHLSETFPWPERNIYFSQRGEFIPTRVSLVTQRLEKEPQFDYRDNPEIAQTVATLFSGALFIQDMMEQNNPYGFSIPITSWSSVDFKNRYSHAGTAPVFRFGEDTLNDLLHVDPTDAEKLKLEGINIYFNMNRLGEDIKEIIDLTTQLKNEGEPKDDVEAWRVYTLADIGAVYEGLMVEEMAHAFYIMQAAQSPESLREFIEETKKYPFEAQEGETPMTPEEMQVKMASPLEQDGDKWVDEFMKRIYPHLYKIKHEVQPEQGVH